ncbi:MAG: hypothetical protein HKO09_12580 [Croceitalea sp.]|nr:hypothetical protein [Croceitalea sp.]
MRFLVYIPIFIFVGVLNAQNLDLPYHQIPEPPNKYTSGNVVSRMIDGLGYRYYWATNGLNDKDLAYKPSADGRTTLETLQHLYGLSLTIVNAPTNTPNLRPIDFTKFSFEELRAMTLKNFKTASNYCLNKQPEDFEDFNVIFERNGKKSTFPYWNMLNGPMADAIYHTGQIVVLRRASGNPVNPGMNVFLGKTRE